MLAARTSGFSLGYKYTEYAHFNFLVQIYTRFEYKLAL